MPKPSQSALLRTCQRANLAGKKAAAKCADPNPWEDRRKNPHPVGSLTRAAWFSGYDAEALRRSKEKVGAVDHSATNPIGDHDDAPD